MSFPYLDYLPCNLTLYTEQILPAWYAAHYGQFQRLRDLMASAHHVSDWPQFNVPNPLPDISFWPRLLDPSAFQTYLREELLQEIEKTNELDFWAFCSRRLPAFFGDNAGTDPAIFLLNCLLYTLCCQIPDETMRNSCFTGNEHIYLWHEYMSRSAEIEALWAPFRELAPQPLADQLLAPQTYQDYLAPVDQHSCTFLPRALFLRHDYSRHMIMGFLDPQETAHLLTHLPLQERPELETIISGCIRDGEHQLWRSFLEHNEHNQRWSLSPELDQLWSRISHRLFDPYPPRQANVEWITDEEQIRAIYQRICAYWNENDPQGFQENVESYYRMLHHLEAEMLARLRYAVERGWGMIEIAV